MFNVMFEFVVKEGFEQQFLEAWPIVTQGIYRFKGSLGSRLHRSSEGAFIAYAQWPDKATYENATNITMSQEYEAARQRMHDALDLNATKTLYELDVEYDYWQRRPFAV